MKVYRPMTQMGPDNNDDHCVLMVLTPADRAILNHQFRGVPFDVAGWQPMHAIRSPSMPGNVSKPLGDRAGIDFQLDPMVLSRRALDVLLPHIADCGQVLPLDFDEQEYSLFNITRVVDALDVDASDVDWFKDGGLNRVKRYVFNSDAVAEEWIFKLPQTPKMFAFVTQPFVDLVHSAGLTGFGFKLLWSNDPVAPETETDIEAASRRR